MTIANDIIHHKIPDFQLYLREGNSLDDIDEYGFTPLIECAIARDNVIAEHVLAQKVDVNKPDVTGRTALHWAVDNNDSQMTKLLLAYGANPNAYTRNGLSVLVYPVLRGHDTIKNLLYHHGAKLDFALDFINAKLIGHRYELRGDVDIVNAEGQFIELDYEGFILEFTVAVVKDSLRRFIGSYSTRHLREHFPIIHSIMDGFTDAAELLQLQLLPSLQDRHIRRLEQLAQAELCILPAASRGHAMCFVKYHQWWAKIDRGENSLTEGSVNFYKITRPEVFNADFLQNFLFKKQSRRYFHQTINQQLGLLPIAQMPISSQISGNCSWANIQAAIPVGYAIQSLTDAESFQPDPALEVYNEWLEWDKDRALDECIQRFYLASPQRQASITAMLAAVLFQACNSANTQDLERAEKIANIVTLPEYYYVLKSYLDEYCVKRLTKKGNNLLKLLDDCGVNPGIGVTPIATGL